MPLEAGVPVVAAAARLGLSPRRVRALIDSQKVAASKVGGVWIVDPHSVERRQRAARRGGRPLDAKNAWALLWLASGEPDLERMAADWISPWMRWYLLDKLKKRGWLSLEPQLRNRAAVERLRCHPSDVRRLRDEAGVVRCGVSAAREHGLDIFDPEVFEAYVPAARVPKLMKRYALSRSDRPNVILHVVDDLWPFPPKRKVVPAVLAALDLLEEGDSRSRRAALSALEGRSPS